MGSNWVQFKPLSRLVGSFSNQSHSDKNKINRESFVNFVLVAIVFGIVLGLLFNTRADI